MKNTVPYKTDGKTQFYNNRVIRLITCRRMCRDSPPTKEEKVLKQGEIRVERDLDIRNLIKA